MKVDKCKKIGKNKKVSVFEKNFENTKLNKRQHKKVTKVFHKNY